MTYTVTAWTDYSEDASRESFHESYSLDDFQETQHGFRYY